VLRQETREIKRMDSREIVDKLQGRSTFPWHPRAGQEYVMWDYEKNNYLIFAYSLQPFEPEHRVTYEWVPIGYGLLP